MAYVTGSAANFGDLKTAIEVAAVGAGWTLADGVLTKGAANFKLEVLTSRRDYLALSAGTGKSGSDLTGVNTRKLVFRDNASGHTFAFPIAYHIAAFESPDEVYVSINYNTDFWQHFMFGISSRNDIGNGFYMFGTGNDSRVTSTYRASISISGTSGFKFTSTNKFTPMFGGTTSNLTSDGATGFINCNIGSGDEWYNLIAPVQSLCKVLASLPNAFSADEMILPVKLLVAMPAPNTSYAHCLGILNNARLLRNDNRSDGEVITVGEANWKTYPSIAKNVGARNGGYNVFHCGTFGFAVRHDGA